MRGARADARGERVRDRLDDLLEYLGESYCNLAGSNAALDTVNTDIDACVSFLLRRERRAARDTVTPTGGAASSGAEQASDLQGEAGAPTAPELPDEIEKILAKARRVVDPLKPKSSKAKAKSRGEPKVKTEQPSPGRKKKVETGKAASLARQPPPAPKEKRKAPLRLPARVAELRGEALQGAEALLESGHFVAGAAHSFRGRVDDLFGNRPASGGPREVEFENESDSLSGVLGRLARTGSDITRQLQEIEGMTQSDQAMLRAQTKGFLGQRQHVQAKLAAIAEYGQRWKDLATSGPPETSPRCTGREKCAMDCVTAAGKLNSASLRWIPEDAVSGLGSGDGEERDLALLLKSRLPLEESKFKRKHEVVARARGLLQQKILQVGIEKDFLAGLLSEVCALAKVQVTANMTMEDAVALERLVALARLSQQLYLDPISNDASGFFFRVASQNESTNLEIS